MTNTVCFGAVLVSMLTRLRAGTPLNRGSIPGQGKILLFWTLSVPVLEPSQPDFRLV